jgi:hypothetical protein
LHIHQFRRLAIGHSDPTRRKQEKEIMMVRLARRKRLFVFGSAALTIFASGVLMSSRAEQTPSTPVQSQKINQNSVLADEIIQRWKDDQTMLGEIGKAQTNPTFLQAYKSYAARVPVQNFAEPMILTLWAQSPDAPQIVQRYVKFRRETDARVKAIVMENGWPQRTTVGDEAAAKFFFLFGHADDENPWRLTQLATLERVFREDHVNPRVYAHFCDRLADVAGKHQIYGTIMGPTHGSPGEAKLYWPLVDDVVAADQRRAQIGLPSVEDDLDKFRQGARIGAFMRPLPKGVEDSLSIVYETP